MGILTRYFLDNLFGRQFLDEEGIMGLRRVLIFAATGAVARTERVALVPFLLDGFAEDASRFLADGVPPAAAVQPQILDTVWKYLRPLLAGRAVKSR